MANVKARCTKCRKITLYTIFHSSIVKLPPGFEQAYCSICGIFKVIITDQKLGEEFMAKTAKQLKAQPLD